MANANTIRRQVSGTQQLTLAPLLESVITTNETAFQLNNNALTLAGGGVVPLSVGVTPLYLGTGQVMRIRATGTLVGLTSSTVLFTLYVAPASVLPIADTLAAAQAKTGWQEVFVTGGAVSIGAVSTTFTIDARLQLSATKVLSGEFRSQIFNTVTDWATTTDNPVLAGGEADLNFVLTATMAAYALTATLDEFAIDFE